jgi:16S rRNA (guanine(1405)-N(7))-methyltransferase
MAEDSSDVDRLVASVTRSAKYRHVSADTIRDLGEREIAHRKNLKDAIKATKNKLHQIGGAFHAVSPPYERWESELRQAAGNRAQVEAVCTRIMRSHASTNERLPILEPFYRHILPPLGPIASVIDVACGLNPLAIPWMPLAPGCRYVAFDIYGDLAAFLNSFFRIVGIPGVAEIHDAVRYAPPDEYDVALVLKLLPCLDQVDRSAGLRLLQSLRTPRIVVSFPVSSLGGQDRGMLAHYESRFRDLIDGQPWSHRTLEFSTELVFVIEK